MAKRTDEQIDSEIRKLLSNYYNRRITNISNIKLVDTIKNKNPYLLSANGINDFDSLIADIVNQYVQISDSAIFGDEFFEPLAIYISGGKKSLTEGVDLELRTHNAILLISIKSGVKIFNANSKAKQDDHMKKAMRIFQGEKKSVRPIVGYCYGKKSSNGKGSKYIFEELAGKEFWKEISGVDDMYKFIVKSIENHSENSLKALRVKLVEEIKNLKERWRDKASEVIDVDKESGLIDWSRLVTDICSYEKVEGKKDIIKDGSNEIFFPKTSFDKVLEKRLALVSKIIKELPNNAKLNRVKIAKAVYLCDVSINENLKTNYVREAAGPLDQRFFYNDKVGVDKLGQELELFSIQHKKNKDGEDLYRYKAKKNIDIMANKVDELFGKDVKIIEQILELMADMNYEQSEIFATVYACWNDLLISKKKVTDEIIIKEFLTKWHPDKTQYDVSRIKAAINWIKEKKMIPKGTPPKVTPKRFKEDIPF